jgi:hypothetical protein
VKGYTSTNFDETKSIHKTVRRPEVVTAGVVITAGKAALRKTLTDINAVDQATTLAPYGS